MTEPRAADRLDAAPAAAGDPDTEAAVPRDPVRARYLEALARRAAARQGPAGERARQRLAALSAGPELPPRASQKPAQAFPARPGALAGLLGYLDAHPQADPDRAARRAAYPEAPMRAALEAVWAAVRADRQLRKSEEQVPENAGPLNSSHLVHRSLSLMRELSPAYLRQFLSYVEALSGVEQMSEAAAAAREAARAPGARKPARRKAR
ncbi:DUF2894 domain-containing protein [Achromobacter sp. Marseille-Q4962]|uniref:DUF2894 domain-containing protein n=1 Tax=Achromobacter sp. Marseille-Q4962 TaxID=2942202 RepID=UPI002073F65C|nr:DUF2894 domain-containing protein [Achromobacter sp. Marseille-Q4962]